MDPVGRNFFEVAQAGGLETVINGYLFTETPPNLQKLRTVVLERMLTYKRFCSLGVMTPGSCTWKAIEPEQVDLHWHVVSVDLPGDAGQRELEDFIVEAAKTKMPELIMAAASKSRRCRLSRSA